MKTNASYSSADEMKAALAAVKETPVNLTQLQVEMERLSIELCKHTTARNFLNKVVTGDVWLSSVKLSLSMPGMESAVSMAHIDEQYAKAIVEVMMGYEEARVMRIWRDMYALCADAITLLDDTAPTQPAAKEREAQQDKVDGILAGMLVEEEQEAYGEPEAPQWEN